MEDYYFTFGMRHKHPVFGINLGNSWVRITAKSYDIARQGMAKIFGPRWSFQYKEEDLDKSFFPDGEFMHITYHGPVLSQEEKEEYFKVLDGGSSEKS